jgi:hypothetical protein
MHYTLQIPYNWYENAANNGIFLQNLLIINLACIKDSFMIKLIMFEYTGVDFSTWYPW